MAVIPDFKATTLTAFIKQHVAPGSTICTDGLKQFTGLPLAGFKHVARSQPLRGELRKGAQSVLPLADRAIGNLQQWLVGTHSDAARSRRRARADSVPPNSGRSGRGGQWLIATYWGQLKQPDKQEAP